MRSFTPLLAYHLLASCGSHAAPVVDADERARTHLPQFERFERWVARTADGSAALPDRAALRETMFAPVRGADGVLGAWVRVPGRPAVELSLLADSGEPSLQDALRLRDPSDIAAPWRAPARSDLWVVVQRPCALPRPADRARAQAEPERDCTVLARETRTASGPLRVVAAFEEPSSAREPEEARDEVDERQQQHHTADQQRDDRTALAAGHERRRGLAVAAER